LGPSELGKCRKGRTSQKKNKLTNEKKKSMEGEGQSAEKSTDLRYGANGVPQSLWGRGGKVGNRVTIGSD